MQTSRNTHGDIATVTEQILTPTLLLKVETSKRHGGQVVTEAAVYIRDRGFLSRTLAIFSRDPLESDFRRRLAAEPMRATAKALETQHIKALTAAGGIEALAKDALAHQEARAARLAAQAA